MILNKFLSGTRNQQPETVPNTQILQEPATRNNTQYSNPPGTSNQEPKSRVPPIPPKIPIIFQRD